ncbi:Smad nuclear-interacting protein 1 [Physocladia obscura]|uniref:Smad nuclear-interacting protein 1 n=1 Tax=Physocladia obscura TaxID=109957 RepID=A0AAD5SNT0_9FUNG|nr:Smad nuclear-interacting protein 1 [Physocladia obscura]
MSSSDINNYNYNNRDRDGRDRFRERDRDRDRDRDSRDSGGGDYRRADRRTAPYPSQNTLSHHRMTQNNNNHIRHQNQSYSQDRVGGDDDGWDDSATRSSAKNNHNHSDISSKGSGPPPVDDKKIIKEAPNFGVSGALSAEANTFKGVVLKYSEPPEARKPSSSSKYRLYTFKGDEQIDMLPVARQSAYLFGRDRLVADIPVDHPSISKQHAALQYRLVSGPSSSSFDGGPPGGKRVKPYLIDLDSANGTMLNGEKIDGSRYYELKSGDVVKFGFSSRDHVFMCEDEAV